MMKVTGIPVLVRIETRNDLGAIRRVHTQAFGRVGQANLVDVLRRHWQVMISLVAEVENEIVGHALLTQVHLVPLAGGVRFLGLGPVAVLPEFQRQGIGSVLVRDAIAQATADGWQALAVLGAPEFFTRFGFIAAGRFGLGCEFRVPQETFMMLELQAGTLDNLQGLVRYLPEFSGF